MDAVHLPADKEMESEKVMAEASQTLPRHRPVSYTHLDVYKRQIIPLVNKNSNYYCD